MIEDKVLDLIKEPLLAEKIKVDKVAYIKEEGIRFLRIFIDKEPFVDVDTCIRASKIISPILDDNDFIEESYILDVCSKEDGGN